MKRNIGLAAIACTIVFVAGCGSTNTETRTGYHPKDESPSSFDYTPTRTEKRRQESGAASTARVESDSPAATSAPRERRYDPAPVKLPDNVVLPEGEVAAGPVVTTKNGQKIVPLQSKGWHCDKCGRTYNGEGWCCGLELTPTR